ncbi:recombinase family protein, partial [Finegoldia magna]|uniref:recombinase family protein n=1 Tax=Finegoldia magna TaxID=1260 RepID=UPI00350E4F3E
MLIIDEEKARVVRRIYSWYLEEYSIGEIIDKLEEKKIKTLKGKERWSKRAIESTLTRE